MIAHDPSVLETGCSPSERKSARRYQIEIGIAAAVYILTLLPSVSYVDHLAAGPFRVFVAVLPMIGVIAMMAALVRFTLRTDEFVRQTIIVSGAIAALGVACVTMLLGFLENVGVPRISMTFVWPMIAIAFGIAMPLVRRRFR